MSKVLLDIRDLTVSVSIDSVEKNLIEGVSFSIPQETIVGLVGASGSGKTTTGLAVLRLLPLGLNIRQGQLLFDGENLLDFSRDKMRSLRGKMISMVFQEPLNAFNPVFSLGYQINEVLEIHTKLNRPQRKEKVYDLLETVGIHEPQRVADSYPHQLSGGMRQRAMIAMAIAAQPKLIIADEPTSNLDVTLQARIMELFSHLKKKLKLSILLITHDLGMVGHLADRVVVMKEGRVVEEGETQKVLNHPQHKYTVELMEALG